MLARWRGELVVSAFAAAEADHLILKRLGLRAELAFLKDLAETYVVRSLDATGLRRARALCEQFASLELGLADASSVVLAAAHGTQAIATFDERHFRTVPSLTGEPFTLVPVDEPAS